MESSSIRFEAPEIDAKGEFTTVPMEFRGNSSNGWKVFRKNEEILSPGEGYEALPVHLCGICSTDLARPYLPYPLPQTIGHEVLIRTGKGMAVVEINASHTARGLKTDCPFCRAGLSTHCPDRITLGIDRLPGGFSPWILAPRKGIIPVPEGISEELAVLTEPFAAALHAVESRPPRTGERIAVVGPGRLGGLLLAALHAYREEQEISYRIDAIGRRADAEPFSLQMGADSFFVSSEAFIASEANSYDIVYDTSASEEGFFASLKLSRGIVHLKSTTGKPVAGLSRLTDMVVDEIALLPADASSVDFFWQNRPIQKEKLLIVTPEVPESLLERVIRNRTDLSLYRMSPGEASERIQNDPNFFASADLPRFDLALTTTTEFIDAIIRPRPDSGFSLLRPGGAILSGGTDNPFLKEFLNDRNIQIRTSRCGDFYRALSLMAERKDFMNRVARVMITDRFPLEEISRAFEKARHDRNSKKILIEVK